jgi:hypothetical protein
MVASQNRGASLPCGDERTGDDARSSRNDSSDVSAIACARSPGETVAGERLA